jgi:hypothetical protein
MSNYITYDTLATTQQESVSDYFNNPLGQWINYATYDNAQTVQLGKQKHTDIRTFHTGRTRQGYIKDLNNRAMSNFERVVSATGTVESISGTGPWTGTITGMSSTTGLTAGVRIFAKNNVGSLGKSITASITSASSSSTTLTYTANNTFVVGQTVKITGMLPLAYNIIGTIATRTDTQFTITNDANPGASTQAGLATVANQIYTVNTVVSTNSITFTATGGTTPVTGSITDISYPIPVTDIGPTVTMLEPENWTVTTNATSAIKTISQASNKWNQLSVAIVGNGTTTISSTGTPINLSSYASTDKISIALPSVPASGLTLGSCYVKFTDGTNVDTISFTTGGVNSSGNNELKFALSNLTTVNKANITGVSFELVTTNNSNGCTFNCMAIRCLAADWVYGPLDINTVEKKIARPAPLNGNLTTNAFPSHTVPTNNLNAPVISSSSTDTTGGTIVKNTQYYYVVTATDSSGESLPSNIKSQIVGSTTDTNTITINWGAVTSATGYKIYRNTINSFNYNSTSSLLLGTTNSETTTFLDTGIATTAGSPPQYNNLSTTWPTLFRSFSPSFTNDDPKIVNGQLVTVFNTGSLSSSTLSNVKIYYRAINEFTTQQDLNNKTQNYLNALKSIDSLVTNSLPRKQSDLSKIPGLAITSSSSYKGIYNSETSYSIGDIVSYTSSNITKYWVSKTNLNSGNAPAETTYWTENTNYQSNRGALADQSGWTQSQLNAMTQEDIQVAPYVDAISYISLCVYWYLSESNKLCKITIESELGELYSFGTFAVNANTNYAFITSMYDNAAYAELRQVNNDKSLTPIYKTPYVINEQFHRRRGRIGWSALLQDPDAYIDDIRSQGLVYAEYKTDQLPSITPLRATQLIADYSPDANVYSSISSDPWSTDAVLTLDSGKSKSQLARKIQTKASGNYDQGISTNEFQIEDPDDVNIQFDVWFPNNGSNLNAYLYNANEKTSVAIYIPPFVYDQWTTIQLKLNDNFLSGKYKLVVVQNNINFDSTWWIDNIQINKRLIRWDARSSTSGPWEFDADDWIDFKNTVNLSSGGVMLPRKGSALQLRGQAVSHYAYIQSVKALPVYATLGNMVWND